MKGFFGKENVPYIASLVSIPLMIGTIIYYIVITVSKSSIPFKMLTDEILIPFWFILIIVLFVVIQAIYLFKVRSKLKSSDDTTLNASNVQQENTSITDTLLLYADNAHKITSDAPGSADQVSSHFIQSSKGSFSSWIYINNPGIGIRDPEKNRYIISHDTLKGDSMKFKDEDLYLNVFTLCYTRKKNWRVWIANSKGENYTELGKDSELTCTGWHHFLLRWDHSRDIFELLIDGKPFIKCPNYQKLWPDAFTKYITIGTWHNLSKHHYVNTWFWRTMFLTDFMDGNALEEECHQHPPEL